MRVILLAGEVGNPTSGQSRFLVNLARGLRLRGVDVTVCAESVGSRAIAELGQAGVAISAVQSSPSAAWAKAARMTRMSGVGARVARAALGEIRPDWYVVLSDEAVGAIELLPPAQSAFICNGDLALMFLSPPFYRSHAATKRVLALGMADLVRQNAEWARRYAIRIGNSEFTRQFMSYLYGTPFAGVVHPPVDLDLFRPRPRGKGGEYVVSVARNEHEQGLALLARLATKVPLRVLGGAQVAHADCPGVVTDERLAQEFSGARFLAFPVVSELFGYAVAESLACATPVLAFDAAGPAEQLRHGVTGWLVRDERRFVSRAEQLFREGYPPTMRTAARHSAERYSLTACADSLLQLLPLSGPPP